MQTARKQSENAYRNSMLAAVHIEWKKLRLDLRHDVEALREERLLWVSSLFGWKRPVKSMSALSNKQLAVVLDELRQLTKSKTTTNICGNLKPENNAEIIHLASEGQVIALEKLIAFILHWDNFKLEAFLIKRWRRKSVRMLTFAQANAAMMIFLSIAADEDLKREGHTGRISRAELGKHIPIIKARLEIDGGHFFGKGSEKNGDYKT